MASRVLPLANALNALALEETEIRPSSTTKQLKTELKEGAVKDLAVPVSHRLFDARRTTSRNHTISPKDLSKSIAERSSPHRLRFLLKFLFCVVRIMWNVASPIKSYLLSFYGLPGDDLVFSHNLNWTMEVDYDYAKALYDTSGVEYTVPQGHPMRFVNMYQDFVVFNRASKWARYLDDFQQDPYVGLFCRTSLVAQVEKSKAEVDLACKSSAAYPASTLLEQKTCRVNEVSEAVMCLKGISVLDLLNYEWQSRLDPSNAFIQQGAQAYQELIFPDLENCLSRRNYLVQRHGRDSALQQLSDEIASNYSLDPTGFAGKKGLYAEYRYSDGFTDLSGKPSGVRYSRMSGSLPERTQPIEPDLNALMLGRERLWWLVGETPEKFAKLATYFARSAPFFFFGMHIDNRATTGRFVERYTLIKSGVVGLCQNWDLIPTSNKTYPKPIYIDDKEPEESVLTAYGFKYFSPRVMRDENVTSPEEITKVNSRLSTQCLTRDGCLGTPCEEANAAGWVTTFDRSGLCQYRKLSLSLLNRQGFVDWRCFGEGTGTDTFSIKILEMVTRGDNTTFNYHQVQNVANPSAIVACVLGGRIPQAGDEPFPNVFLDLLGNGANTIVTTTFSRGSEKVLMNMYALVAFVGCTVFSYWVLQNLVRIIRVLGRVQRQGLCDRRTSAQLFDSAFTVNISTVSHGRNRQLSTVILWVNLVSWYIGAADINCTWWVNGVDLWTPGFELKSSDSPYYQCKPGNFLAHLTSVIGVVRFISISYNFKSLTCLHEILRGATRFAQSFVSPIILFGVFPTFVVFIAITGINHLRHHFQLLMGIHNQMLIVMLWIVCLLSYHTLLHHRTLGRHYVDFLRKLKVCDKQKIKHGTAAAALIGPYYLALPEYIRPEEVEWIPLSVAMESPRFDLDKLDFASRKYSFIGLSHGCTADTLPIEIPQWVLNADEYFFC